MEKEIGKRALRYHNFILSIWGEGGPYPDSPPVWRCSLEDPHTGKRLGFKNLAELTLFLNQWLAATSATLGPKE